MPTARAARMPPFKSPEDACPRRVVAERRVHRGLDGRSGRGLPGAVSTSRADRRPTKRTTNTAASTPTRSGRPVSGEVASRHSVRRVRLACCGDGAARERASRGVPLARDAQRPSRWLSGRAVHCGSTAQATSSSPSRRANAAARGARARRAPARPPAPRAAVRRAASWPLDLLGIAAALPRPSPFVGPHGHARRPRLQLLDSLARSIPRWGRRGTPRARSQAPRVDLERRGAAPRPQVQGDDHRKAEVDQLQDEVQVARQVRGIDHGHDDVGPLDQQTVGRPTSGRRQTPRRPGRRSREGRRSHRLARPSEPRRRRRGRPSCRRSWRSRRRRRSAG